MTPRGVVSAVVAVVVALAAAAALVFPGGPARAAEASDAPWLADRGTGVRTSIFATYVRPKELLVSPFFELYYDKDYEYKPAELGYGLDQDFFSRFRAQEGLIFLCYGFSDRLALEFEAAVISAKLDKAPGDTSSMPPRFEQSGRGDWQFQLDWRIAHETASRPEVFGYFEVVPPSNRKALLIGTPDWEFKAGGGVTRGLSWGTWTARVAAEYSKEEGAVEPGEYALEYVKRVSKAWRLYAGVEGTQDEVELIGEAQWHFSDRAYLRLNTAYGLSKKATDWAPDVGFMFTIPLGASTGR